MNISGNNNLIDYRKFSWLLFLFLGLPISASAQGTQVDFNSIPKSGTALVYAHQDDDLIWMLPFWNITEKFIGGAMPITPRFEEIINNQQIYMDNNGYNIPYKSNWFYPWGKIENDEYQSYYWGSHDPEYAYLGIDHLLATWVDYDTDRNEINRIKSKIEQYIASPDVSRIITHNNWGEYGHYHHKQLNKAVRELAVKYRKDVWMLGCDNGDFVDITVPAGITYTMGSFNPVLFDAIRELYKYPDNWWTWSTTRKPSGDHKFIKIVEAGIDKSDILTGATVTVPGPDQYKTGAYIFDGVDDYMTLAGNNNTSFTIAMWIRPDEIKAMDISKMAEYPLSSQYDRALYLQSDGRVTASINDGQTRTVTSATSLSAGAWAHILMSGNGEFLKLYIDGELEGSISAGSATSSYTSPEFVLGQAQVTSSFFMGQIAEVKFFNYAMNPDDPGSIFKAPTPTYAIDFYNERTSEAVPSTDEYSYHADMSDAVSGSGQKLNLTPGEDVYFRTRAGYYLLASQVQILAVPEIPATPAFAIDFSEENTTSAITSGFEYAYTADMSGAIAGSGSKLDIVPGNTVYFRKPATSSSFSSLVQTLVAPARPATPSYTINYATVETNEMVALTDDYSTSASMTDPVSGTNAILPLVPGTDLYFMTRATSSSFKSEVQFLDVKSMPAAPSYTIDYVNSTTFETVDANIEVSEQENMTDPLMGAGEKWNIEPGKDLYFRQLGDTTSFSSDIFLLEVSGRNSLDYFGGDTITESKFVVRANIEDEPSAFSLDDLMIANGTARNLRAGNTFDVYPTEKGNVTLVIPANAFMSGSFASNILRIYYNNTVTGIAQDEDVDFGVYPNPSYDGMIQIRNPYNAPYTLEILTQTGSVVKTCPRHEGTLQQLNLGSLQQGMYFLKFHTENAVSIQKLILE